MCMYVSCDRQEDEFQEEYVTAAYKRQQQKVRAHSLSVDLSLSLSLSLS